MRGENDIPAWSVEEENDNHIDYPPTANIPAANNDGVTLSLSR